MFQLSFNQKVGLGFAIIITLLAVSGLSSLWNLNNIDASTSTVNETAVPVVKESNRVQIQLLKLAKLSSLAFNAEKEADIYDFKEKFGIGGDKFDSMRNELGQLAKKDPAMQELADKLNADYAKYKKAVLEMFDAKLGFLEAEKQTNDEANALLDIIDNLGGTFLDIQYFEPEGDHAQDMELVAGYANDADNKMQAVIKTIDEIKRTSSLERLDTAHEDFDFTFNASRFAFDKGNEIFQELDTEGFVNTGNKIFDELKARLDGSPNIVDYKRSQLEKAALAKEKLHTADKEVSEAVEALDKLLAAADDKFNTLQGKVSDRLDYGFKSSIVLLVVLIVLTALNFNSMRIAIRKKMIDLAKLNKIGGSLAAAQSQNLALEEVLQSFHEKTGVAQGSVYLTNEHQELEVKAYFPPKAIEGDGKAAKFAMGQGILGKAAEEKKVIFVPNTLKDSSFVSNEGDTPKALLCVPLVDKDILVGVMNFSGDVRKVSFADSDYEFVSTVARSLVTTIKNIRMREVIEEQNRNLEKKVEERTAALRQKNNDIANMMANMHQGLFTITDGGLIHPEYSAFLEAIFETDRIANRNFTDLLFSNTNLSVDIIDQITTAVDAIVGEDEMMWEFNSHLLQGEMNITMDDGRQKILELDWDPIIDKDNDVVDKVMVTVRDVTELKALEAEAAQQKQELEVIGEILAVDPSKLDSFLSGSYDFISECRDIIKHTKEKNLDIIAKLFRSIHTVKGNARTYDLKQITDKVHMVESTYDQLRNDEEAEWNPESLLAELSTAEEAIRKYEEVFREKLGRDAQVGAGSQLDKEKVSNLLSQISELTRSEAQLPSNIKSLVSDTYNTLIALEAKPVGNVLEDVIESSRSLAKQLDKPEPKIEINDEGVFIRQEVHDMLNNVFMHVFRNALDHGIEGVEERESKGKPAAGKIVLDTTFGENSLSFSVKDDGRGMAIKKIYEMAISKGIYEADAPRPADAEIANLVFSSGFSTAEQVTAVSGRGVGMDAVRNFLQKEGGDIEIVLDGGNEGDDFRSFTTVISLPDKFYTMGPRFAA